MSITVCSKCFLTALYHVSNIKVTEGATGVEPVTSRSAVECSATELYPLDLLFFPNTYIYTTIYRFSIYKPNSWINFQLFTTCNKDGDIRHSKVSEGANEVETVTSQSAVECSATELYPQHIFSLISVINLCRYIWSLHVERESMYRLPILSQLQCRR